VGISSEVRGHIGGLGPGHADLVAMPPRSVGYWISQSIWAVAYGVLIIIATQFSTTDGDPADGAKGDECLTAIPA
jgi:hypothetical protein